jgi:hypothetical protein
MARNEFNAKGSREERPLIDDDRLNPASTTSEQQVAVLEKKIDDLKQKYILFFSGESKQPPEKEREDLEKAVRSLIYGGAKSARIGMIIQNLASRFNLYNNLWLKQMTELESGVSRLQKKKGFAPPPPPAPRPQAKKDAPGREIFLSLNDEGSFDKFFTAYQQQLPANARSSADKEHIINSMKSKMVTHNLVEIRVNVTLKNGKLNITIKE